MDRLSDSELWSRVDRGDRDLDAYVCQHPEDAERVDELRRLVAGVRAAGTRADAADARDPERIGPYRIVGRLGAGGMGIVYDAREDRPPRAVALKVLRPGLGGSLARDRFEREIRTLARLEHPSIARLYAAGEHEGAPWFAMERVPGQPLDAYVRNHAPVRRARLVLFVAIARAVAFAHRQGVVHRDLKPQNVLVDDDGTPRIVDFGLARWLDVESSLATRSGGEPMGTLAYMSPEQARGRAVDARSDVFSLGAMLFELLADRRPRELADFSLFAAMRTVGEDPLRPLARVARAVPKDLAAIADQALAHEPDDRTASADELADDVERWLRGEPVRAARPTWRRRLWMCARRHALVTTLVVLLVSLAGTTLYMSAVPTTWLQAVSGDWFGQRAPFAELAWRGDVPLVRLVGVDGRFELERIDDLDVDYVIGTMKQWEGESWRKRFSEDLYEGLHRMGHFALFAVDLQVVDPVTRERLTFTDVELTSELRRRIWLDRNAWPFELRLDGERARVELEGADWELVELCGVPLERLLREAREHELTDEHDLRVLWRRGESADVVHERGERLGGGALFDALCEALGRSPTRAIDFTLRDPETSAERTVEALDRRASDEARR